MNWRPYYTFYMLPIFNHASFVSYFRFSAIDLNKLKRQHGAAVSSRQSQGISNLKFKS